MMFLEGLSKLGASLNPPFMGDWPFRIGQYMINFAGIEMVSYQYLVLLEASRADFEKNVTHFLSVRIDRILRLIDASSGISDDEKVEVRQLWEAALELSKWRNRIAHNPLLPTWKPGSNSDRDPPDLMGIPDMKQIKSSDQSDSISLEGMVKLVEASFDLAQRLNAAAANLRRRD